MSTQTLPKIVTTPATLAVADIFANPLNIRHVAEADRGELSDSLKAVGQLSRIWVRPHPSLPGKYELVDGERRWWGAQAAGLQTLDASVGNWSDEHVVVIAFTTGSATTGAKRLDPLAEARGLKWLKDRTGATLREIGERVGVAYQTVHRCVTVLEGHTFIVEAVEKKSLPMRTAFELSSIEDPDQASAALKEVLAPVADGFPPLSSDATHILIKKRYAKPRPDPVVTTDQVALTRAQSLEVFPAGAADPEPESGFVALTRPIPPDLLKPEIAAGAPIKFADVVTGVTVYVGVDEGGKSVPLVKLAEALAAVQPDDRHIFKEDVARSNSMPKPARVAGEPPSRRVEEEAAAREAKKAAVAQRKKDKATGGWLQGLLVVLEGMKFTEGFTLWSLLWDHALDSLTEPDAVFLAEYVIDVPVHNGDGTAALNEHVSSLNAQKIGALAVVMLITARVRAKGLDSDLVKEWHEAMINPPKFTLDAKILAEWVKADALGMPHAEIARSYGASLADVEGALESVDDGEAERLRVEAEPGLTAEDVARDMPPELVEEILSMDNGGATVGEIATGAKTTEVLVRAALVAAGREPYEQSHLEFDNLRNQVLELLSVTGMKRTSDRESAAQLACKCSLAEVKTPEQWTALRDMLKRVADAKAKKAKPAAADEAA